MSLFLTATNLPPTPKIPSSPEDRGWDRYFPPLVAAQPSRHARGRPSRTSSLRAARAISGVYARAIVPIKSQYDLPGVSTACSSMPSGVNSAELLCAVSLLRRLQLRIRDSRLQVSIWRGVSASMACTWSSSPR
ncbi:hypothetical protein C8J57DRAFT_1518462 [Mycena rebaudengoi]|nr:hypothetical protein C8J57DRAFT_1518462 [Mycena rebaudengoi]